MASLRPAAVLLLAALALAGCGGPAAEDAPGTPSDAAPTRSSQGLEAATELLASDCTGYLIGARLPPEWVQPYLPPGYEAGATVSFVGLNAVACASFALAGPNGTLAGAEVRLAWLTAELAGPAIQEYVLELYVDGPADGSLLAALARLGWEPAAAQIAVAADGFRIGSANATYAVPVPLPIPDGNPGSTGFTYDWHHQDAQGRHEARLTYSNGFGGSIAVPGIRPSQVDAEGGVLGAFERDRGVPFTGVLNGMVTDVVATFSP